MKFEAVIDGVRRVAEVRSDPHAVMADIEASLSDVRAIRAFCDASEADLARRVAAGSSFPESTIAERSRDSLNAASKTLERAETLDAVPNLAAALDDATVTAGHVDAVTRASKGLDERQRDRLFAAADVLVDVARHASVEQFRRRVRDEASRIVADDGVGRLERQRRDTRLSTWVGGDGMWNVRGRFDPVTGLKVAATLETTVETLFAESTPDTCPSDPFEKQKHLRALAFARLVDGVGNGGRPGRPEFVAVIDVATNTSPRRPSGDRGDPAAHVAADGSSCNSDVSDIDLRPARGPRMTWPIPIEVPQPVLVDLMTNADVHGVVVCDGAVLHAPGTLDLGRTTRLASRAQRRALRGLYRGCAIPGCSIGYDRCKLHHVVWWRHGGTTDLDNLLPVCSHHHHRIHDDGWHVTLAPDRALTLTFPDGTVRNTGPPRRHAT